MKTKKIIKLLRAEGDPTRELSTEAANRLEMLSVEQKKLHAKLAAMKAELNEAVQDLKECGGCPSCKYKDMSSMEEPCISCFRSNGREDKWEWRGAKDTNVPSKTATDTNVGDKED